MPASRGSTPSTGRPVASIAETISAACRGEPALFRITPLSRTSGSKVCSPCTMAAAVRDTWQMSSTRITGAPAERRDVGGRGEPLAADLAVEQAHHALDHGDVGRVGVAAPCSSSGAIWSGRHRCGSRLRPGRPVARAW